VARFAQRKLLGKDACHQVGGPPAANGTTTVIWLSVKVWASAATAAIEIRAADRAARQASIRSSLGQFHLMILDCYD
jgi:hypothetical protein